MKPYLMTIPLLMVFFITSCDFTFDVGVEHSQNATPNPPATPFLTLTPASIPSLQPSQTPSTTTQPTPLPTSTSTPVGQIFRDDFSGVLQEGWTWINEVPERWTITPEGWLQILGQDPTLLDDYQNNLLCRPAPSGDYQITVHLEADPVENFQQATLYLYQDVENYIAINRGYCGPCLEGGSGLYLEYKISGSVGTYKISTRNPDVYLRLLKKGGSVTAYYALEEGDWQRFGTIGNYVKEPQVCLGVSNADRDGIAADLVGRFDYIEFVRP